MLYTSAEIARGPDLIRSQSWNWSDASRCVYRILQWYNQQMLKSSLKTNKHKRSVFNLWWIILKFQSILFRMAFHQANNFQVLTIWKIINCTNLPFYHWKVSKYILPPLKQNTFQNRDLFQKINFCALSLSKQWVPIKKYS